MVGNPLCHFELMALDVEKAKKFYGAVFDWRFESMPGMDYTAVKTGAAPEGGLMLKPKEAPVPSLGVYFLVENIEQTLEKVQKANGRVIKPRTPIPEMGAWAMFMDPDGICVGIFEAPRK
ncbi:MAG: VOC family protein [Deltaproteobacteria bacterium]|nr:VOC family protein [Deltaproteobacteria bacterium]